MPPLAPRLHIPPMSSAREVVVIGAGAAGLMAAISAAESGAAVRLLERTEEGGKKILISGGGRCNVLPAVLDARRFVTDSSPHHLRHLLAAWPLPDQRAFFEGSLGIPLREEPETGKLFPVSNRARDVRDGLRRRAAELGVVFQGGARVTDLVRNEAAWLARFEGGGTLSAPVVVLAVGGASVPATGSDGAGFGWLKQLGHTIHDPYPALTPLTADPAPHAGLAGVSLEVSLAAGSGASAFRTTGGFLFTHRGYSGPSVLDISHRAVRSARRGNPEPIRVRWCDRETADWEERLGERSSRQVLTVLREALPARLVEWLLQHAGVEADRQLAQLRREERLRLVVALTRYQLPWTGDEGYRKAEVTGGGLALDEVDRVTLESRRCPGLFIAGELLDAFGPIGGYNFCWAWATGRSAGRGAAERVARG